MPEEIIANKYQLSQEPTGVHRLIIDQVPIGSSVLDIGCASGYLGKALKTEKNCRVFGIEPDASSYALANGSGDYEYVSDLPIEKAISEERIRNEKYARIICADVLEHLANPDEIVRSLKNLLSENGRLIVSLPNVAHYSVRFALLRGKFDPTETGILDRTHLHFYTKKSAIGLFEANGWEVVTIRPRGDLERWLRRLKLEPLGKRLLFSFSNLFAIQYIFVLKIK